MNKRAFIALLGTVAVGLPLALTARTQDRENPAVAWSGTGSTAHAVTSLPIDSLEDWVTYADRLVIMTATSEERGPFMENAGANGEGLYPRLVTLITEQSLWIRPRSPRFNVDRLTVAAGAWVVKSEETRELAHPGTESLKVGDQFAVLLTFGDPAGGADPETREVIVHEEPHWFVLESVPVVADLILLPDTRQASPARTALNGLTLFQAADLLQSTPPDPAAAPYMDLTPVARFHNVVLDTYPPMQTPSFPTETPN